MRRQKDPADVDSLDRVFSHALNTVNKIRTGSQKPPSATRLRLYGLYKQAMGTLDTGNHVDMTVLTQHRGRRRRHNGVSARERRAVATSAGEMVRHAPVTYRADR
jgi:hypothetical protein